jgi:hypothetical protein
MLFATLSIHLLISVSRVESSTVHAVSLSVCQSMTQLHKAFSLDTGALSLQHSLSQLAYGMTRVPRNPDPVLDHCTVLDEFLSVFDSTMILVVELLESFIPAY